MSSENSKILQCFRAVGIITEDVPFSITSIGEETFLTVSIGRAFQIYNCDKLTPVIVSPQLPYQITALASTSLKNRTFTACNMDIYVWNKLKQLKVLSGHHKPIIQLLAIGSVLLSLGEDKKVNIWDVDTLELANEIILDSSFSPTFMMHPSTYLNKILIGSETGSLEIWNIRKCNRIFTLSKGWSSAVTCISQSPAIDVVAVGFVNGTIAIINLRVDKVLMVFNQEEDCGSVTSLSFRSDSASQIPMLASGSITGNITLWNLQEKKVESSILNAHDGSIVSLQFLPNEPLLISSGVDNSIRMWIFDSFDASARLLRSREGHKAPPIKIRYYGGNILATMADGSDATCCQILSAGQDRAFRVFHTAIEQQSTELSQGPLLKKAKKLHIHVDKLKLSPIIDFAAMETRSKDWSNIITCHENDTGAYVWQFDKKVIGKHVLRQNNDGGIGKVSEGKDNAVCVCISSCGNFGLVGTAGGAIFKYNMQSGEKRGSYPKSATKTSTKKLGVLSGLKGMDFQVDVDLPVEQQQHIGAVSGICVDALNHTVISAGVDGNLHFWDFINHNHLHKVELESPIIHIEVHADSNLVLVACDDQVLRLYDITSKKLVRRFQGHTHRILDAIFSRDARWIISSSADNSVRIWDIPSGKCIDWMRFPSAVTGLAISPTGEFLATSHVGQVGIFLYANRCFFTNVFLDSEPAQPVIMELAKPVNEIAISENSIVKDYDISKSRSGNGKSIGTESNPLVGFHGNEVVKPLASHLLTLSTAPRSVWQTLFNLEVIKQRNKPNQPPKAPERAPFFLATSVKNYVDPTFEPIKDFAHTNEEWESNGDAWEDEQVEDDNEVEDNLNTSRILQTTGTSSSRCKLATLLMEMKKSANQKLGSVEMTSPSVVAFSSFEKITIYLSKLSASAVDVELSTLCMGNFDAEGILILSLFLDYLRDSINSRRDFQLIQAYLNRFLKLHSDVITSQPQLLDKVNLVHCLQKDAWQHINGLLSKNLCLVQHFSKIQM